jgi:hypothetical protein
MNRIRTVKPELFRHLALFEAEEKYQMPLRIAFVGLFTCCDRRGRFLWQPRRLKVDILPYDDVNMDDVLNALIESGFIRAYEVNGLVYGCIPSWGTHQYFNGKEADSKLPDIQEGRLLKGTITQSMLTVHARLSHETLLPINPELDMHLTGEDHVPPEFTENSELPTQESLPDESVSPDLSDSPSVRSSKTTRESREPARVNHTCPTREALNGKERKGKERVKTGVIKNPIHCPIAKDDVLKIFTHWQQTMQHPQARLDSSRDKWIRSALRMGYSVDDCCQAITGCSVTPHNQGCNERGERYDGLHVIFRSADQIDRFMQNATSPPRPSGKAEQRLHHNTQAAQAWLNTQPPREA